MLRPRLTEYVLAALAIGLAASSARAQAAAPSPGQPTAPEEDSGEQDDEESAEEAGEARVPWKGTTLKWSHTATTTILGVGADYQSSAHQVYSQGYWAMLNYYLVDSPEWKLRASTSPGFDVELTNSDTTTDYREPQFRDLNATLSATVPLAGSADSGFITSMLANYTTFFPTSEVSAAGGTYLVTSPRLTLVQTLPFLGKSSAWDFMTGLAIAATVRWDHRFTDATVPVNDDLEHPGTATSGDPITRDQLSGSPFIHDRVRVGGILFAEEDVFGNPLEVQLSALWTFNWKYAASDASVCPSTGNEPCADPVGPPQRTTTRSTTTDFGIEAIYWPMVEWGLALGYSNTANRLGTDGLEQGMFYSPDAVFTGRLILSLDALYEVIDGPRRTTRFYLPG